MLCVNTTAQYCWQPHILCANTTAQYCWQPHILCANTTAQYTAGSLTFSVSFDNFIGFCDTAALPTVQTTCCLYLQGSWTAQPWWQRHHNPMKHREPLIQWCSITLHKTWIPITSPAYRTQSYTNVFSSPTHWTLFWAKWIHSARAQSVQTHSYGLDDPGLNFLQVQEIFLFSKMAAAATGPTHLLTVWLSRLPSWGVKQLGHKVDSTTLNSAKVVNESIYTSTPPAHLHGMQRDKFTFLLFPQLYTLYTPPKFIIILPSHLYLHWTSNCVPSHFFTEILNVPMHVARNGATRKLKKGTVHSMQV
jgi:hypothetical protein